ncbi:GGDEF domain-containing protein [Mesorhizobium sp. ASY16-5R]|uniref:GGDEF domain-containing protein n=1 Tax=Mesorhizobium sp. ASY16-5R TaxID=3445772 RepID=UPI003F9FA1B4
MNTSDAEIDPGLMRMLTAALGAGQAGVCLCDENDDIRYVNETFRNTFFPDLRELPVNFVDAMAEAIASGRGIRLQSMTLDVFVPRIKQRRRIGAPRFNFSVDIVDGSWWWVNDCRLDNGWVLAVATDITTLKNEESRLRDAHADALHAAETDVLTGLPNRRSGMATADAALNEFRANRLPLTFAIIDLDHFKFINDTYGHVIGDEVLVHFAKALVGNMGSRAKVSRLGGEEFLVVMPETSPSRAAQFLDLFMRSLRPYEETPAHPAVHYSFSAGVASASPGDDLKSLFSRADLALYAAKKNGRGQIHIDRAASNVA